MKTAQQIVQYITLFYERAAENPAGYFRNMECMEDDLCNLESLRNFIIDDASEWPTSPPALKQFYFDKGYGALGYAYGKTHDDEGELIPREPMRVPSDTEVARMKEFATFWREYLAARDHPDVPRNLSS